MTKILTSDVRLEDLSWQPLQTEWTQESDPMSVRARIHCSSGGFGDVKILAPKREESFLFFSHHP